jgi:predicted nucleic acid-binding protein
MSAYSDTSFLCALYRGQDNNAQAIRHANKMQGPLQVTSLTLYEFRQSIRFQEFLHGKDPNRGFDHGSGRIALANLQGNIAHGKVLVMPADWADVYSIAERLSAQYTSSAGHRAFDILHVATALHLGAGEFLTFDANHKTLPPTYGLKTPL